MKYDFTGKAIKCDTFPQLQELERLAKLQGLPVFAINFKDFNNGFNLFQHAGEMGYTNLSSKNALSDISYSDFIASGVEEPHLTIEDRIVLKMLESQKKIKEAEFKAMNEWVGVDMWISILKSAISELDRQISELKNQNEIR